MATTDGRVDPALLREEIRLTRAELGETVQALAAKADVKARVRRSAAHSADRARVQVHDAGVAVRRDPVPWAAIAAGTAAAIILLLVIRGRRA
jgi:hypothetical protein